MATYDELVAQVQMVKTDAEQLAKGLGVSGQSLQKSSTLIATLSGSVSRSGMDAARAVGAASHSVREAGAAMLGLGRACDTYLNSLRA